MRIERATMSGAIDGLSTEARGRLAAGRSSRIGAVGEWRLGIAGELLAAGLIGEGGGLTILGSAVAERLQREHLDRMFA